MLFTLYSPKGTYDARFLANYAYINLVDPLTAFPRNRQRADLRRRSICDAHVGEAGPIGQAGHHRHRHHQRDPVPEHREPRRTSGRRAGAPGAGVHLRRARARTIDFPEEFGQIVVRETPDGGIVRVKDVARMELGSQDYSRVGRFNGKPSAIIAVYQLPGSNAVDAAKAVNKLIVGMKQTFPQDVDYVVSLERPSR